MEENTRWSSPFGPFTRTLEPLSSTCTPPGISTGKRPMRDTVNLLPHLADNFAAHAQLSGTCAGHNTLRGGENGNANSRKHPWDVRLLGVNATTRRTYTLQTGNHCAALATI